MRKGKPDTSRLRKYERENYQDRYWVQWSERKAQEAATLEAYKEDLRDG